MNPGCSGIKLKPMGISLIILRDEAFYIFQLWIVSLARLLTRRKNTFGSFVTWHPAAIEHHHMVGLPVCDRSVVHHVEYYGTNVFATFACHRSLATSP